MASLQKKRRRRQDGLEREELTREVRESERASVCGRFDEREGFDMAVFFGQTNVK